MFKRVVVVYNPRSSQAGRVKGEVLAKLPEAEEFEVADTDVDDNARKLAKILEDGDLVIAAGGDATATIGINGSLLSGVDAIFVALPYGNFSDVAKRLGAETLDDVLVASGDGEVKLRGRHQASIREVYPLEILVDGEHLRYGLGYFTVGLLAEAAKMFDRRNVRRELRKGKRGLVGQLMRAMEWYGKHRKRRFLPEEFVYNGSVVKNTTDMIAMNTRRMSKVMRGEDTLFKRREFRAGVVRGGEWLAMMWFGLRSVLMRVPLLKTKQAMMEFDEPTEIEVQGEGEYKRVRARGIEIRKSERGLRVILKR